MARRRDRQARHRRDAERRQFPAAALSGDRPARRRRTPTAYLSARGFVLRAVGGLRPAGLPANDGRGRRGEPRRRRGAGGVHGGRPVVSERLGPPLGAPLFDRLALIGVGLIGSSIARAARRKNLAARHRHRRQLGGGARARHGAQARRRGRRRRRRRRRPRPISSSSACRSAPTKRWRARSRRSSKPGAIVSDVGSVKGAVIAAVAPHLPKGVASRARPSGRRHRAVGPGRRLRDAVRQSLVHPDPGRGRRSEAATAKRARVLGGARRQRRDDGRRASRSGAGDHQPCAASDRLQHRRHRLRPRRRDAIAR